MGKLMVVLCDLIVVRVVVYEPPEIVGVQP